MIERPARYGERVIRIEIEARARASETPPLGLDGWRLLEEINRDAWAFAGLDADAVMRRDVVEIRRPARLGGRERA